MDLDSGKGKKMRRKKEEEGMSERKKWEGGVERNEE